MNCMCLGRSDTIFLGCFRETQKGFAFETCWACSIGHLQLQDLGRELAQLAEDLRNVAEQQGKGANEVGHVLVFLLLSLLNKVFSLRP